MSPTLPVTVEGGTGGITAQLDGLRTFAGFLGSSARELGTASVVLHGYLVDPVVLAAGMAAPAELACYLADLGDALDGVSGLTWVAAQLGVLDFALRAAATGYSAADELHALLTPFLGVLGVPDAIARFELDLVTGHDPLASLQAIATSDPDLADTLVDVLALPALLHRISGHLPDGSPVVTATGDDATGSAGQPPRCLADVVGELAQRNDGAHGAIDVRILTDVAGRRRAIVDITGTKSASIWPTPDVTGLITDAKALVGARTTYEDGVLDAMQRAGVRPDDDVMLVGHSEGGMVAVTAARDAVRSGRFRITHIVTAGSPIGLTVGSLPPGVQVLALENRGDVVPHLDGRPNPDLENVTTVTGRRGDATVLGDHGLDESYLALAGDTDAAQSRSVRDFLAGAAGFFRATHVRTSTFVVTRRTR